MQSTPACTQNSHIIIIIVAAINIDKVIEATVTTNRLKFIMFQDQGGYTDSLYVIVSLLYHSKIIASRWPL